MGENTREIERDIVKTRADLGRNLEELGDKVHEMTNWRIHYRRHPGVFLGAAAGAGFLVGVLTTDATHNGAPAQVRSLRARGAGTGQLAETWGHLSNALVGLATAKVVDIVSDFLPGFRDQYDKHSGGGYQGGRHQDDPLR